MSNCLIVWHSGTLYMMTACIPFYFIFILFYVFHFFMFRWCLWAAGRVKYGKYSRVILVHTAHMATVSSAPVRSLPHLTIRAASKWTMFAPLAEDDLPWKSGTKLLYSLAGPASARHMLYTWTHNPDTDTSHARLMQTVYTCKHKQIHSTQEKRNKTLWSQSPLVQGRLETACSKQHLLFPPPPPLCWWRGCPNQGFC